MRWTRTPARTAPAPTAPAAGGAVLSRRALLGAGGATGALSALTCLAAPRASAAGLPSALAARGVQVGGGTTVHDLAAARGGARLLSAGGTSTVAVPVSGGHMVGVTFPGGTDAESVAVRVRRGGTWGDWAELPLNDSEPDPGTREAAEGVKGSDPLWTGPLGADAVVEVRLPAADAAQLHVVDAGGTSAGAQLLSSTAEAEVGASEDEGTGTDAPATTLAAPVIRSRAAWGADESLRRGGASYSPTILACVVHHTADGGSYTQAEVPAVIRGMYRYHTVSLGWADLGYNFVVDRFGGTWEGRAGGTTRNVVGAHAGGFNADTFGVSMMGDFTSVAPPAAMLDGVARVIAWKFAMHGLRVDGTARLTSAGGGTARYTAGTTVTLRTINAHRDVGFTACPGNVGFTKMGEIRSRVAALLTAGPAAVGSAIDAKYAALGGAGGFLGAATTDEGDVASRTGRYRFYRGGLLMSSTRTGAHVVRGAIQEHYGRLGWEKVLGFPTTDDSPAKGGFYTHFESGSIYWSPRTGAHEVRGAIRDKWASTGWEGGPLGFPTTGDGTAKGGWYTHFEGGSIYCAPATGAHVVRGAIRDRWAALGWERGALGFPTTDDAPTPNGRGYVTHFQGGSIYFSPATGAHAVRGAFRDTWAANDWENGFLGFPTSDERAVSGGLVMDFQGGRLVWSTRNRTVSVERR